MKEKREFCPLCGKENTANYWTDESGYGCRTYFCERCGYTSIHTRMLKDQGICIPKIRTVRWFWYQIRNAYKAHKMGLTFWNKD